MRIDQIKGEGKPTDARCCSAIEVRSSVSRVDVEIVPNPNNPKKTYSTARWR